MKRILSIVLCMAMVVGFFAFGAVAAETKTATLVTDKANLAAGDQVIIVGKKADNTTYALSTTQNSNNRGAVAVTISNNITLPDDAQVLTLAAGTVEGTFSFSTGAGYLYAASSSKNYLRTQADNDANSSFTITITNDGVATITAQGSNTRNLLCYNSSNNIFGCYASDNKQQDIFIYKLGDTSGSGNEGSVTPPATPETDGYTYTKVTTSSGLVDGYYTMVTSSGDAPLVLDGTWVTKATVAFSNDDLINSYGAIWQLDVDGNTVKITDKNGEPIAPTTTDDNKMANTADAWGWTFENGTFCFSGQGSIAKTLAQNVSDGRFRAYKDTSIESQSSNYLTAFTLYKVEGYTPPAQPQLTVVPISSASAAGTKYMVKGTVTLLDGKNVYIQDATGAICVYLSATPSDLQLGDVITATGTRTTYKGLPQLGSATYEKSTDAGSLNAANKTIDTLGTSDICTYVTLTDLIVVEVFDSNGSYTTPNITVKDANGNTIQIYKAQITKNPDGNWSVKVGDILTFAGAVGYNNKYQLRNTKAEEITVVCAYDKANMTWTVDSTGHKGTCSECGKVHVTCSTELVTKYNNNKHWDECPDCDCATAQLDHTMSPEKDATHHWTACACGKATAKVAHDMEDKYNETHHWQECTGCDHSTEANKVAHDLEYKSNDTHHWQECKDCDYSTEANKVAHDYGTTYQKGDVNGHYQQCACGKKSAPEAHNDGDDADNLCDKCGLDLSCTHANGYKWNHDATNHWEECKDCGLEKTGSKAAHTMDTKKDADKHWNECTNTNCGYATEKVAHTMAPKKDADKHWTECACGHATEKVAHTMDAKKDADKHWTECACGHATEKVAHTMNTKSDETHHWTECTCGQATEKVEHTLVSGKCECGYSIIDDIKDSLAGEKGDTFTVTGVVNLIDGKNVYIQDGTGGICIYLSAAPEDLKLGDTITATGKRDTYNGLPELVKATYEKVADSSLELKPAEKTVDSLTAADVGTYVTLTDLTVVEVFDNDGAYSTPNITVKDAKGNEIQIYKAQISKVGEAWSVKVGDKITVTASVGIYKQTLQLRNTVAGEIVVTSANSATGDIFGVMVAMMAVSGMGLTAVLKKKH